MQLVAMGAQDVFLTGNPQITFFKVVYRRHTNFSKEAIEQEFNSAGNTTTCTLARNGDLVQEIYLKMDLQEKTGTALTPTLEDGVQKKADEANGGTSSEVVPDIVGSTITFTYTDSGTIAGKTENEGIGGNNDAEKKTNRDALLALILADYNGKLITFSTKGNVVDSNGKIIAQGGGSSNTTITLAANPTDPGDGIILSDLFKIVVQPFTDGAEPVTLSDEPTKPAPFHTHTNHGLSINDTDLTDIIKTVEVEIGGQKIDKHYSTWLDIYNELFETNHDYRIAMNKYRIKKKTIPRYI